STTIERLCGCSKIYLQYTCDGATQTQYFMLKTEHESELFKELTNGIDSFAQESKVYQEILPCLEKLYQDAGQTVKFGAKCYKLPITQDHLLLEDLKQQGFKNANRLECLDMHHAKMVLKKMAQWHAASVIHKENIGSYEESYKTALYTDAGRFCTAVGVMAVALIDSSEMSTLDKFDGDGEDGDTFKLMMFTNKRYHQHMNAILPWLLNRGYLDF
ncbi:hypothetical protein DOY81_012277, partial [Sarcophaga bullata]